MAPITSKAERRVRTVTTINGRRAPSNRARISVFDNAVLYADGIFETLLSFENRVVFLDEHLDRLYRGADALGLELPVDRPRLAHWMVKTVSLHPARIKKLRLTITRGESARWVGVSGQPQVILSAAPHTLPVRPFSVWVSDLRVDQTSGFRTIKTLSYALNATAYNRARMRGCDDALLLNSAGRVAEITSANIFWVKRGRVYTPPVSSGCLGGVTRIKTFSAAERLGIRIEERDVTLRGMVTADELFLTSSLKLLLPVGRIRDGQQSWRFATGPLTQRLRQLLRKDALS